MQVVPAFSAVNSDGLSAWQRGNVEERPDGSRVQNHLGFSVEHSAGLCQRVGDSRRRRLRPPLNGKLSPKSGIPTLLSVTHPGKLEAG